LIHYKAVAHAARANHAGTERFTTGVTTDAVTVTRHFVAWNISIYSSQSIYLSYSRLGSYLYGTGLGLRVSGERVEELVDGVPGFRVEGSVTLRHEMVYFWSVPEIQGYLAHKKQPPPLGPYRRPMPRAIWWP